MLIIQRSRGFTIVELIIVVIVLVLIVGILLPALAPRSHHGGRQIKDSTQVRGIHQGMVLWSQEHHDQYPMPSLLDVDDQTVAEKGRAKDTTANIFSILIYNGYFSPELCVSPAESNNNIQVMPGYSYSNPSSAAGPDTSKALWDPAFSADFTAAKPANFSYGHMLPADDRMKDWSNTFDATKAIIGNRGPQIASMASGKSRTYAPAAPTSNTYLIHGGRNTWEGNIAYNDNHVCFETALAPESTTYKDAAGTVWFDCLFFDEPDDPTARNNFLGIYTTAGDTGAAFKSIWD
jgi:competence protein ComGC